MTKDEKEKQTEKVAEALCDVLNEHKAAGSIGLHAMLDIIITIAGAQLDHRNFVLHIASDLYSASNQVLHLLAEHEKTDILNLIQEMLVAKHSNNAPTQH